MYPCFNPATLRVKNKSLNYSSKYIFRLYSVKYIFGLSILFKYILCQIQCRKQELTGKNTNKGQQRMFWRLNKL